VVIKCERCKGKGHTIVGVMLISPYTAILSLFERNDPNGLTRERCSNCKGKGYLKVNVDED
jgi:DnaJ-class molecular chaperone